MMTSIGTARTVPHAPHTQVHSIKPRAPHRRVLGANPGEHQPGRDADDGGREQEYQQISLNLPVDVIDDRPGHSPLGGVGPHDLDNAVLGVTAQPWWRGRTEPG